MMLRWLEDCCDRLARRISAEGTTTRRYAETEFADLVQNLIQSQSFRSRSQRPGVVVLVSRGRRLCDVRKSTPALRYRLQRNAEGHLHVMVFEHLACFAKSKQAHAMRELCEQRLAEFLTLLNERPPLAP